MKNAASALIGVFNVVTLFTLAEYGWMQSWAKKSAQAAVALSLFLLGAVTGLLAGHLVDSSALGALLGSAALRADVGRATVPQKKGARSAAAPVARVLFGIVDEHCRRRVGAWAGKLSPADLVTAAEAPPGRDNLRGAAAKDLAAVEEQVLAGGDPAVAARGQLLRFIQKMYSTDRFPRPTL